MSKILYFDCFAGASGDMVLGALLDAGLPLADLQAALGSLMLPGCSLSAERVLRAGVSATKFRLHDEGEGGHRHEHAHPHGHAHTHEHAHADDHAEQPHPHHGHRSLDEIVGLVEKSAL